MVGWHPVGLPVLNVVTGGYLWAGVIFRVAGSNQGKGIRQALQLRLR